MSHGTLTDDIPARRIESLSSGLRVGIPALIVLGAIAFAAALMVDAPRAWRAYHFNWLYFTTLAQGGVILAVVVSIAKGMWSRPVRRIALAFAAFLPIAYIAVLPILLVGAEHIFPWIEHPIAGKDVWLNQPFMAVRTLLGLAVLFGVSIVFAYTALRPDMEAMRPHVPARLQGMYGWFTRGWRGQEVEEFQAHKRLAVLAPLTAVLFALFMGLLVWDFVMSLEPYWFSTLIGPYVFMGGFLGGIMATAIIAIALRHHLGLHDWIQGSTLHDLGKLGFGFTVFWGYLFFSQYIVIWYGLLPLEQSFVIHRFTPPFRIISQLVGLMIFVIPFFGLMGVTAKRTPAIFVTFASISLLGLWLERYLLVYPSLWIGTEDLPFGWQEPGVMLLFAGLFLASIGWFLTRFPLFQVWQPASELELQGVDIEERYETGHIGGPGSRPE
ncbi:MAG TPA: hypothetical protein VHG09_09655 [Longimicrobiales bacterium]|nr:hypothetical protein [Longimicrobiales bacterium]